MKLEEIIKLLDAGYTKAEIEQMNTPDPAPEPAPEPAPDPAPKEEKKDDAVLAELQKLTKAVYAMNIMNSGTDKNAEKSADEALEALMKG